MGVFVIFPPGSFIPGALYLRLFILLKIKTALLTVILWMAYPVYEYLICTRILCTDESNIRIDLLLIYPLLLVLSLVTRVNYYRLKNVTILVD